MSDPGAGVKRQVGSDPQERGERHPDDFYRTGAVATRALLEVERFPGVVWEPACGMGDMSVELEGPRGRAAGITEVVSSDLIDRGFGIGGIDFLLRERPPRAHLARHVITNPPFKFVEEFMWRGLEVVGDHGKVALIARLQWLEGTGRKKRVFDVMPPARVWVFPYRVPMGRWPGPILTGLVCFAWFVWDSSHVGPPQLGWLPGPNLE